MTNFTHFYRFFLMLGKTFERRETWIIIVLFTQNFPSIELLDKILNKVKCTKKYLQKIKNKHNMYAYQILK